MKQIDLNKLNEIIDQEGRTATERMLYRDTFAVACDLHAKGEQIAGLKLISTLFDQLGRNLRKTYFAEVVANLSGNEERYAMSISAHTEINKLFFREHAI